MNNDKLQWLYILASSLIIIGALPVFGASEWLKIIYAIGVLAYTIYYLIYTNKGKEDLLEQRIVRLNRFASILLLVSVLDRFGFLDKYGQNLWVFFLGLALIFILYANILLLRKK